MELTKLSGRVLGLKVLEDWILLSVTGLEVVACNNSHLIYHHNHYDDDDDDDDDDVKGFGRFFGFQTPLKRERCLKHDKRPNPLKKSFFVKGFGRFSCL